jgi:hypothetical protein
VPAPSRQQFEVLVYDQVEMSPKTLVRAAERAEAIFRDAGLEMIWIQFRPKQSISQEQLDKVACVVRVLPNARTKLSPKATGEALPCDLSASTCYANIFFDRVQRQAKEGTLGIDQILGHAIAHELGHLLLGDNSHASTGLMRAVWQKQDLQRMAKGDVGFRPEEAEMMQGNLLNRFNRPVRLLRRKSRSGSGPAERESRKLRGSHLSPQTNQPCLVPTDLQVSGGN